MWAMMVEGAVGWQWWLAVLGLMWFGGLLGYILRGAIEQDRRADDYEWWEDAQRAARVYQREIDRAKARHPSGF